MMATIKAIVDGNPGLILLLLLSWSVITLLWFKLKWAVEEKGWWRNKFLTLNDDYRDFLNKKIKELQCLGK